MVLTNYKSEFTERELMLIKMHRNKMYWHLRKEEEMTSQEAFEEIERLKRKAKEIEAFEQRQIERFNKINIAKTDAAIKGTNEIFIMSEV